MGKKPLGFLHYESVITPGNEMDTLSSVNILKQGKILVKIKTNIPLDPLAASNLDQLIQQTIMDYLTGKEMASDNQLIPQKQTVKTTRDQSEARAKAADDLFSIFNL